jgi:hypothetical protein
LLLYNQCHLCSSTVYFQNFVNSDLFVKFIENVMKIKQKKSTRNK